MRVKPTSGVNIPFLGAPGPYRRSVNHIPTGVELGPRRKNTAFKGDTKPVKQEVKPRTVVPEEKEGMRVYKHIDMLGNTLDIYY